MITNVEMDHHSRWGSIAELRAAFAEFAAGRAGSPSSTPALAGAGRAAGSRSPATTTCSTPAPRWPRSSWPALDVERGGRGARRLPRRAAAARAEGRARTAPAIYDDYAHHPTEVRAALSALRGLGAERLIAVFQPHLYSRTKAFAEEFGAALALADEAVVLDVYPAREEPVGELAGVSGLLVARAAADRMGGRPVVWAPTLEQAREALGARLGAGPGAGHGRRRRRLHARRGAGRGRGERMSAPPDGRRARLPAGAPDDGPHRRPRRLVRAAGDRGAAARAARLGRGRGPGGRPGRLGLEPAGRRRRLPRPRAQARRRAGGDRARRRAASLCGGGARLPSAAAKAAGWGLSGLEFGINIPGTAGGAVKMNANAYGGQLAEVLEWVDVCTAGGHRAPRSRRSSASPTAAPTSAPARSSPAPPSALAPADPDDGQRDAGGDARAPPRGAALRDQDLRLDLQEPRGRRGPRGRTAGQLLEAAGCRGPARSAAPASPRSTPTSSRTSGEATTADVLELMAEGRRRVHERFGVVLEPEVQHARRAAAGRRGGSCEAARIAAPASLALARRGRRAYLFLFGGSTVDADT